MSQPDFSFGLKELAIVVALAIGMSVLLVGGVLLWLATDPPFASAGFAVGAMLGG